MAFPRAEVIQQVARETPLDRLLVETDAPFLAPPPHRGKRNEPAFVVEVARKVAALRGTSVEAIGEATRAQPRAALQETRLTFDNSARISHFTLGVLVGVLPVAFSRSTIPNGR